MKRYFSILTLTMIVTACEFNIKIPANSNSDSDLYLAPDSILYKNPQKVAKNIYSAIGATAPPTYENSGHNNNLSFIITNQGIVVINAGASYLLAQAFHREIKKRSNKTVRYVILENAQGHAMGGSNYWQQQGALIIAHKDANEIMKNKGKSIIDRMKIRQKEKGDQTQSTVADIVFDDKYEIKLGKTTIQALHLGPAHSPGDIVVWLPKRKIVISGDMAFHQRLLPVTEHTNTAAWINTWNNEFETLQAKIVIPGHGTPTVMTEVRKYTRDYLIYIRSEVESIIDNDGDLQEAYNIDLSAYQHLDTFDELAMQNIGRIFRAMEFE